MSGCPGDETLLVLVGGSLARPRELEVKRHVDGCAPCRAILADLARGSRPVSTSPALLVPGDEP